MLPFALNRDQNFEHCWKDLPFGFKFLFLFLIAYNVLSMFLQFLFAKVAFEGYLVAHQLHLWRVLIPYIPAGPMPSGILNILINFFWLLPIIPALERKYSTSYILIEIFLQNFLISIILTLVSVILYDILPINPEGIKIYNFGIFPVVQVFLWQKTAENPQEHTKFCCMPCLIPMKWIPVLMLIISMAFSSVLLPAMIVGSALGYIQFMRLKRRLLKLPMRLYRRIDSILPKSITTRQDFVKVQQVQASLQSQCIINAANTGSSNPFQRNHNVIEQVAPAKVQVFGKGISIGGGNNDQVKNFKGVWAQKADQIEVEPTPVRVEPKGKGQQVGIDDEYFQHNDTNMRFNDNASVEEQSEDGLEEKDQKKVAKQNLLQ